MERMLAYQCDATTLTGFLADGSRGRDVPGVLVCHEANGLGERAKQAARQLANLGLVAFAMDLYGEAFPIEDTPIHHARLMSTPGLMARRASAALARLTEEEHVDPERLAAIGFCQGGVVTLELARQQAPIRAAIGFHPAFARCRSGAARCDWLLPGRSGDARTGAATGANPGGDRFPSGICAARRQQGWPD